MDSSNTNNNNNNNSNDSNNIPAMPATTTTTTLYIATRPVSDYIIALFPPALHASLRDKKNPLVHHWSVLVDEHVDDPSSSSITTASVNAAAAAAAAASSDHRKVMKIELDATGQGQAINYKYQMVDMAQIKQDENVFKVGDVPRKVTLDELRMKAESVSLHRQPYCVFERNCQQASFEWLLLVLCRDCVV